MRPAADNILSVHIDMSGVELVVAPAIKIPLQGEHVVWMNLRIDAEAALNDSGIVFGSVAFQRKAVAVLSHHIDAEVSVLTDFAAVAKTAESILFETAASVEQKPLRLFRAFRADVDHAIDRVRAPERCTRTANNFNLLEIGQKRLLHVPKNAREKGGVETSAIHQHLHLVCNGIVESARRNGPGMTVQLCDFHLCPEP